MQTQAVRKDQAHPSPASPPSERMQCMEVWGGNQRTNRHLEMSGLEAWVFSEPHQQARGGGDVYYVSSCASGRITRLLLADVSGHGVDAARSAIGLRELMRRNVNIVQPTKFVRAMNRQFAEAEKDHRFATALVCSFFSPTGRLTLCNAGHPDPLFLQQNGRWVPLSQQPDVRQAGDFPLGVLDDADYSQTELALATGELLLLFSDAFSESRRSDGTLLGTAGLLSLVETLDPSEPERLIPQLIEAIQNEDPNNLTDDDATAIVIRSTSSTPSLKDNLLAPLRLLGSVQDRTEIG